MSKIHSVSPMLLGAVTASIAAAGIAAALYTAPVPVKPEIAGPVIVVAQQSPNAPTWEVVVTKPRLPEHCLTATGEAAARCETLMAQTAESYDTRLAAPATATASARGEIGAQAR